ncbi:MAG: DEAD/DEAH box helicase family protein [Actinobacteria bacterium]|nr:DEAD/DEAH box helicase family protein [Actinomycetota bacterium]MCL6104073.1 DEAD/DEAH box helicase family protein [Actinomycetota bacterium]
MELREYQKKVLDKLSEYLLALNEQKDIYDQLVEEHPELKSDIHFPKKAWEKIGRNFYHEASNGLGEPVADIYIKVPTGGGKTLLACHGIDLINRLYIRQQHGLVLWIVPTSQIYEQTLKYLKDREHPYRQLLDISSGGRTLILEKLDNFNTNDVENNLCILLLMLPSASRQSRETLKIFQDNSGYTSFFPPEDAYKLYEELVEAVPNLDTYGEAGTIYGKLPLTSLGNVLRILKPIIIIDEGHKAYSQTARETIYGFNPSFVLELSATPPKNVNKLIQITGRELNDEQMIKLDLHVTNKSSVGWKETLSESVAMRDKLERLAKKHEQNTGVYIRPILLIQVERTGKDQRQAGFIHAEDAKEYLLKQLSMPQDHIAIKSSDTNDIEGMDLLSRGCPVRFIITKKALQEGWDCPFAYVLCVLAKSQSEVAMTQLIGRILRQPYARKTGNKMLDECYVYSFQHDTGKLVSGIKQNLESEGLGDIAGRIAVDEEENPGYERERTIRYRSQFKKFEGKIYLPVFAINDKGVWREVSYQSDILARVDWSLIDLSKLGEVSLGHKTSTDEIVSIGYRGNALETADRSFHEYYSQLNIEYIARQLLDVIPNPWISYSVAEKAIQVLLDRFEETIISSNLVFVMEELRKRLDQQREKICQDIFRQMLTSGTMKFYLLKGNVNCLLPTTVKVRSNQKLTHTDGEQLQMSLFDCVPKEDVNGLEEEVALYLDKQEKLLWWYRNISQSGYRIQGWKPNRIYPDFIAANKTENDTYNKVYVLETKGEHLSGNPDTEYKRELLNFCSARAVEKDWDELSLGMNGSKFIFTMVDELDWCNQLNTLIETI